MSRWDLLKRGCRGRKSRNFVEAVETHRPKARVSAVGKAEEARCYGGNFESLLERWKLSHFLVEVWTHRPKARVSAVGKAEKAR